MSASGMLKRDIPTIEASRAIVSRGSISTVPRLPITTTRPPIARTLRSRGRFTLASISRMTSNPRPPVAATASSMYPAERWSKTACAPSRRTRAIPSVVPAVPKTRNPAARAIWTAATPTPPLAPWTRTVSPGTARILWKRARQAVAHGTPTAAPCAYETLPGSGWTRVASHSASAA